MPVDEPPQQSFALERIRDVVESGLSAVPVLGGLITPHYRSAVAAGYQAELESWLRQVADVINRLEQRLGAAELETRMGYSSSIAALNATTQSALRTSSQEKRRLLRNALANTIAGTEPEDDLRDLFLALIDRHNAIQVQLLQVLQEPFDHAARAIGTAGDVQSTADCIYACLPNLRPSDGGRDGAGFEQSLANIYGQALERDGLCVWGLVQRGPSKISTLLGDRYLEFLAWDHRITGPDLDL